MSLFDQPYYAVTKAHMSRIGIWPEQSKYVRVILPSTMFIIILTLVGPSIIRLHDAWRDIDIFARNATMSLIIMGIFFALLDCVLHVDRIKFGLKKIEEHWEMVKNTPAVIVLDRYAERGLYITVAYTTCVYVAMILCFGLCLSPIILDFVDPLNETRPKIYIIEAEYGVDPDQYYWFITAHIYIVATITISMMVAVATMYILWVVHVCALFEVVILNLELIADERTVNQKNAITLRIDTDYKKIRDCIILHAEAISFADLIEDSCSGSGGVILALIAFSIIIAGVQALLNWKHTEVLIQHVTLTITHLFHLYIMSIPGQELINCSEKVHTTACV